jgi:hypothetical protein
MINHEVVDNLPDGIYAIADNLVEEAKNAKGMGYARCDVAFLLCSGFQRRFWCSKSKSGSYSICLNQEVGKTKVQVSAHIQTSFCCPKTGISKHIPFGQ